MLFSLRKKRKKEKKEYIYSAVNTYWKKTPLRAFSQRVTDPLAKNGSAGREDSTSFFLKKGMLKGENSPGVVKIKEGKKGRGIYVLCSWILITKERRGGRGGERGEVGEFEKKIIA